MQLGDYYIERRTAILVGVLVLVVIGAVLKLTVFNGSSSPTGTTIAASTTTTTGPTTGPTTGTTPSHTAPVRTTPVVPGRPTRTLVPKGTNAVVQGQAYTAHCTGTGTKRRCHAQSLAKTTITLRGLRPPTKGKVYRVKTNSHGFYQIQVKPGLYLLSVAGHKGALTQVNVFPHQLYYAPPLVITH